MEKAKKEFLKNKVVPLKQTKTVEELIQYVEEKFAVTERPARHIKEFPALRDSARNFYLSANNQSVQAQIEEFEFVFLEIGQTPASERYDAPKESRRIGEPIVVLFEKKTGCMDSNSQLLLLELFVVRGISEEDYINETGDFGGYMMYLDTYLALRGSYTF